VDNVKGEWLLTEKGERMVTLLSRKKFNKLKEREVKTIFDEIHQPDRRALDEVVFDVLGLTEGEREAVYDAVVKLVQSRLERARSVSR